MSVDSLNIILVTSYQWNDLWNSEAGDDSGESGEEDSSERDDQE